jgi:hypothetical protein
VQQALARPVAVAMLFLVAVHQQGKSISWLHKNSNPGSI